MKKSYLIVKQAMIAAIYAAVSLALAPIAFGTVQARISEALTLLPVFGAQHIIGITLGCFITNLVGVFTGRNILGWLDIIFGTLATLGAGVFTFVLRGIRIKKLPLIAAIPPIIFNAVVVGWELCIMINGGFNILVFTAQAVSVGVGEALSVVIGLVLVKIIESNDRLKEIFTK